MTRIEKQYILEEMAKAGYEKMFDSKWENLHPNGIDRTVWLNVAEIMLRSVRFPQELYGLCQDLAMKGE